MPFPPPDFALEELESGSSGEWFFKAMLICWSEGESWGVATPGPHTY